MKNKVEWKAKLASRKFWALVVALATSILGAVGASDDTAVKITGIIAAVGACAVYMLAEAITDASNSDKE
ncbi:hypothetical protein P40081_28410 [Paenibacillus sp. FSL P4-0081]|uniref:hypothetical protein n=1 Tax=Paenibacillus sp. FSL P4-0081 TaxID=1536769 RepID=UPI0004F5CC16|nr:hypothetical protein [Paenibacillus sp. FSL P4-0081]AIQ31625.1 hypothetical protein P40081_28410 [Paenibacillus sp. FSL P4-0081]